jgi:hypothetical protein
MSSSNFIRWGAIGATMLAGALSILIGVLSAIEENSYSAVESTCWVVLGAALVGLYLYLRRSGCFGWLGAVGCYMSIVGCVLNTIVYLGLVPSEGGISLVGVFLVSVGPVLFGVGIVRAESLPRAGGWLIIVSIPIFVVAVVASTAIGGAHWPNWFFVVGEVAFGSGLIVPGYGQWVHRGEPLQPEPQARVR